MRYFLDVKHADDSVEYQFIMPVVLFGPQTAGLLASAVWLTFIPYGAEVLLSLDFLRNFVYYTFEISVRISYSVIQNYSIMWASFENSTHIFGF